MKFDKHILDQLIKENYLKVQKHPSESLYIYNYTPKTQYDRFWNEYTMACRGLILDDEANMIARPFPKFFNLGEMENQEVPDESFEVFEKMDGSLGILYWLNDEPFLATRGSFISEQSVKGNEMLKGRYKKCLGKLNKAYTYLFEIIYPENRIVVDYGSEESLTLLAVIETKTGREIDLMDIGFPLVKKYDGIRDIDLLKNKEVFNKEGFVIKFADGYRLKVKFDEYVRIHRIITNVSSINIWEYLRTKQPFDDILEKVPDEFYQWVKETKEGLLEKYEGILKEAKGDYKILASRKETALYFQTCKYPAVMFNLLDGKPVDETIWKILRPKFEKPFLKTMEDE